MWGYMDREERKLRRSGLVERHGPLSRYVNAIACRLGIDHCPDIRVYVVRTPLFNASMAPNGTMQIWSGLLLRVTNEAQLAAVIGHELGHYLERHSLQGLREAKDKAAVNQVLGLFGAAGALGQMAVTGSFFSFGRDQEREADRIGAVLMHRAGYDVEEAANLWDVVLEEQRSQKQGFRPIGQSIYDSHPPSQERHDQLLNYAKEMTGGVKGRDNFYKYTSEYTMLWCEDELKRQQPDQSISLFTRLSKTSSDPDLMLYFAAESTRQRNAPGDSNGSLTQLLTLSKRGSRIPQVYRSLGLVYRGNHDKEEAIKAFRQYLELNPQAPDQELIRFYIGELTS